MQPSNDNPGAASPDMMRWGGNGVMTGGRRLPRATLKASEARYRQLFDAIDQGFCVVEVIFGENGRPVDYRFIEVNAAFERQTGLTNATQKTMREHEPAHEDHWFEIYGRIALSGEPERFEAPAAALGHEYEVFAFRFDDPALRRVGILFNDIAARKQAERTQRMLTAELNHRVKNTLTLIQSMARQSLRGIDPAVLDGFLDRVSALGRAHDLLAEGQWRDASLRELLRKAVVPHEIPGSAARVSIAGPDLRLSPPAAQSLTLAFHELATNAAKYGALSAEGGRVAIAWEIAGGDDPRLVLRWTESGGPPIGATPDHAGFGTRLLKQVLAVQLGGDIDLAYLAAGLVVRIEAPVGNLSAPDAMV